jgi:hypothetical protein
MAGVLEVIVSDWVGWRTSGYELVRAYQYGDMP